MTAYSLPFFPILPRIRGLRIIGSRRLAALRIPGIAAIALLTVVACTVADYQKPIGDMATGVNQSIAAIHELDAEITALRDARWRKDIVAGEATLNVLGGTCSAGKSSCELAIRYRGETEEKSFPPTSVIPKAEIGLAGLKTYVENLQAIVDADMTSKVAASANAALGSVKTIEAAIADVTNRESMAAETFRAPVVDAIAWITGQYVLYTKVEALKRATTLAQPVINDLALFYNDIAKAESTVTLGEAVAEFVVAQEDYDKLAEPNLQQIDEYVAAASRSDAILSAMNAHPLQAFADAHERLYSELNGKITLPEALSAIEIFVARAQEFRQIVDDFELAPKGE